MGMDYIPEDSLLPRMNPRRTRRLLEDARAAHINLIRVWGGGTYPADYFYDACDELGLLVWQDFMFACAAYNLTDEFEKTVTAEFTDNFRRLCSHPSLALWCGNNEVETFTARGLWVRNARQKADYIKIFEYVIIPFTQPDIWYNMIRRQPDVVSSLPCAIRHIYNRWRHSILLE